MIINNIPLSKGTEKLISEHKFSLKSFKGIEDILLEILQLHNKNYLKKAEFKKMLNACLSENKTNPKDIYYLSTDDIEIPWFDENKKSILVKDLRNSSTSFKQELNDLKKDIQDMVFENNIYQESLVPNINSMNFSNGKTTYSFTEIENYIKKHGFMFERGANRKIMPEWINNVKIEFKENYFDKPCIVLHVFYTDSVPYTEEIIPLIFFSLPVDPEKNYPYITCFNNAVLQQKNNQIDHLSFLSLDSFEGKRIKGTNKKVSYVSNDTSSWPKDAIECSLDDNIDNNDQCYIIPSTLNGDEVECLRISGTNELISSIYPKDSLMGKDITLVEIENSKKTLIYLDTLEKAEITIPGTNYMITNIDIVTNKYSPITIAGKKFSRVKVDNDKFLFLDSIDLNPTTYNGTNEFMRHDNFRRIILGGKSIMILKNDDSTIFVDPKTGSKIDLKIAGTNDIITDLEFYMYRVKGRKNVVFKAQINDNKRVVIDQARKITNIDPNSLERPQELSLKDRMKLF